MVKDSKELKIIKSKLRARIKAYKNTGIDQLITYEASVDYFARMDELEYILDWINRKLAQEVKELK